MIRITTGLAVIAALVGCDPKAKANSDDREIGVERQSKLYESCATTSDCTGELRCFDRVCRSTQASVIGDYHAALGAHELAAGNVEAAIKAYSDALNTYEADKITPPLEVLCGKGGALTAARDDREQAEKAASTLHRCLLRAPVGSTARRQGLADLAKLGGAGLDPVLLGKDKIASEYLTLKPKGPASDNIALTVTSAVNKPGSGHNAFVTVLQGMRGQLIGCWESHYKETQQAELSVALTFRSRFQEGEYEEDDGYRLKIESAPPSDAGGACVFTAVQAVAESHGKANRKKLGRWQGDITLTLK